MSYCSRKQLTSLSLDEVGETLVGFLVSTTLAVIISGTALGSFLSLAYHAHNNQVIAGANERAKNVLDLMTFELRLSGAGMPLGQSSYLYTDSTLGDAPLPLLTDATVTSVTIRRNESGVHTYLTSSYTPAASALTFAVASAADFEAGDIVYINDAVAGGKNGLRGTVQSATSTHITLSNTYLANAGAAFAAGATVERVSDISFLSSADGSGILRDNGPGFEVLAPNTTFSLVFLDSTGAELALPLTAENIVTNLTALRLTVQATGDRPLKNGSIYSTSMTHTVALRNLTLLH